MSRIYLLTVIVVFALIHNGVSLRCYNCTTAEYIPHVDCRYLYEIDQISVIECIGACLKLESPGLNGYAHVERGCYRKDLCKTELSVCHRCEKDLCNNSTGSNILPSLFVLLTGFAFVVCKQTFN